MIYNSTYKSKIGNLLIICNDDFLTGIWFYNQKYFPQKIDAIEKETTIIKKTKKWLDEYFDGKNTNIYVNINPNGTTFQKNVWEILKQIPYGKTVTYGEIAKKIAKMQNVEHMSARAVGTAIGKNPISIIIPCHRVVGTNNSLAGYAGGIDKKIYLLKLEKAWEERFFVPKE